MGLFFTLFLFDIVLGFIPQATGCAICLFTFTKQSLKTKNFLFTSIIFSAIAVAVRLICNYGLIDFGFHTILIWMIFVVVAIMYNKLPVLHSTFGIMLSGILIVITEVIAALIFSLILGAEQFNAIMDNTSTIEGQITRAVYGIPMNILFVAVVLALHFVLQYRRRKAAQRTADKESTTLPQ
jgi:hypothetical protein